jgi:tryptophan-rich sensory protein
MMQIGEFWIAFMVAVLVAAVVAFAGSVLTDIGPWYAQLKKPAWKPPDWAFGPIWTIILALACFATAFAWVAAPQGWGRTLIVLVLGVNCVLHVLWNVYFFKMRRPDKAMTEVIFLWLSILSLIVVLGYYSTLAGLLLIPYIIWVTAAAKLNYDIVRLNAPFGGGNVA